MRGELAVGARLPAERAMAESFGVNRVTIRSALDRLTIGGLLSRRQGSGYRVLDYRRTAGPELLGTIAATAAANAASRVSSTGTAGGATLGRLRGSADGSSLLEVVSDLLLMRRNLARALFEALSQRIDRAGFDSIVKTVDDFAAVVASAGPATSAPANIDIDTDTDTDSMMAADMAVLFALLEASKSAVLPLCFNPIIGVLNELPSLSRAMYADPASNVAGYRAFCAVLSHHLEVPPAKAGDIPDSLPWIDSALSLVAGRDALILQRLTREQS